MDLKELMVQFELHDVAAIRASFAAGIDPNSSYEVKPLVEWLIGEYTRSVNFKHCILAFKDFGLEMQDSALMAVLTDDADSLVAALEADLSLLDRRYSFAAAYTPLHEASLLHLCAEFNHLACAKVLVQYGLSVDVTAGFDSFGFGGQTPIFHTVNQNNNQSYEVLQFLLSEGADLTATVKGLIWGQGYPWETLIPAVNPISYAMMGLLPQMHRSEQTIAEVVQTLLSKKYGIEYPLMNVPNAYLRS